MHRAALILALCLGCREEPKERRTDPSPEETAQTRDASSARASVAAPCDSYETCRLRCRECGSTCSPAKAAACEQDGKYRLQGELPQFDLEVAAKSFERACEAGRLEACAKLGLQVQDGRGVKRDPTRALSLYERACEGGIGVGCFNLGLWHQGGRGGVDGEPKAKRHFARALAAYEKQCSGDQPTYCENLGYLHEVGMDTPRDLAAAESAYRRGCDADGQVSCLQLGLLELGAGRDARAATARLEKACERSVPEACGAVGERYLSGLPPFERDVARGLSNLDKACQLGSGQSCQHLGAAMLGERGEAGRTDAELKLARSCDLGGSSACFYLAGRRKAGGHDLAAVLFYTRACDIGHPEGCAFLGASYQTGSGVPADPSRALDLYEDACHLGDFGSCVEVDKAGRPLGLSPLREARFREAATKAKVPLSTK